MGATWKTTWKKIIKTEMAHRNDKWEIHSSCVVSVQTGDFMENCDVRKVP